MPDLEQQLVELGRGLEWPATPRIRFEQFTTVHGEAPRRWGVPPVARWVLAAAAAVLIFAIALTAYPPSRTAIAARWALSKRRRARPRCSG